MSDIPQAPVSRAESIRRAAEAEVEKEQAELAKKTLLALYKRKASAVEVVNGIDREIETTMAKIDAGAL